MRVILLLSVLLVSAAGSAQTAVWKRFGQDKGLPSNTITAIAQSRDGIMWFGSQSGLIRFDGVSFKKIPLNKGDIQPYVQSILNDKDGNVWVGSREGLWKYDVCKRKFKKQEISNQSAHITGMVWDEDTSHIYIATGDGICVIKCGAKTEEVRKIGKGMNFRLCKQGNNLFTICLSSFIRFNINGKTDTLCTLPGCYGFARLEKDNSWLLCSASEIVKIDPAGRISKVKPAFNVKNLAQEQPVYSDKWGRIWFNTHDTVYCFRNLQDPDPVKYAWQKDNPHTALSVVNRIFTDREGNTWFGSGGSGLSMLDARSGKISFLASSAVSSNHIWSVLHDKKEKKTLYGTNHNVAIADENNKLLRVLPAPPGVKRFTVTGIIDYDNSYWYISTYGASGWRLNKKDYSFSRIPGFNASYNIESFVKSENKELLVSAESGFYRYDISTSRLQPFPIQNPYIASALHSIKLQNGNYCFGSTEGITIANSQKQLGVYNEVDNGNKLNVVFAVHETPDKKLFVVNMSGALYRFNFNTKKFTHINLAGEPGIGYCIAGVSDSLLVITTNNGLVLYNHYTNSSALLNRNNGLPFNDFDQFGCFIDNEYFMASGPEGAISVKRSELLSLFHDDIDLRIQHHDIVTRSILIPAGHQSLAASIYIGSNQVNHTLLYEYTLQGLEEEWHTIERGNEISYNYLPPGEYTLLVKATDPNHVVGPRQVSIAVTVVPLWYQTTWFKAILVLLAAVILVLAVRYASWLKLKWKLRKLEAEQKVANERMRISRELHDNVGSQLTYLITGLEASEMMLKQQKTEVLNDNLEQLQQSARDSMQQLRDSIWALNKEEMTISLLADRFKNWVHKMLALQQISLRLESDIEQDITLDAIKALNLFRLLQEAIHNVIKHAGASEIFVTLLSRNNKISCQVHDNGRGFIITETEGNGLQNMHTRAKECGGTVKIDSEPNKGTTITVELNTLNG